MSERDLSFLKYVEPDLKSRPRSHPPAPPSGGAGESDVAPFDWPEPGPIDLAVHDLPHASSTTEWWYLNGHCTTASGRNYSLFVAFFRQAKSFDEATKRYDYAHSVTWALIDADEKRYFHVSGVDPSAPAEGLKRMRQGLGSTDNRLNRALEEILERGKVPSPDRILTGDVTVEERKLALTYGGCSFRKLDDGTYQLCLLDEQRGIGCDVVFEPLKPPTRHGNDGVVRGSDNERMFYYFIPRCRLTGAIRRDNELDAIESGQGWYDHEFGLRLDSLESDTAEPANAARAEQLRKERRTRKEDNAIGWDWLSTQLDDGTDVTVYPLTYLKTGRSAGGWAIVVDKDGNRSLHEDITFEPVDTWQSTQTFFEYPTKWRCRIPSARLELVVTATFPDQEFLTLISKPSFWEGRVDVTGKREDITVSGLGIVERSGFTEFEDLDGYFEAVGRVVRKSVREVIPRHPTYDQALLLIGSEGRHQYMDGMNVDQYGRTMIAPIREITDRGGKGWRSYAALTCVDVVGGDSRDFVQWLALPEMMHVGSLIVDDVQDKSTVRRGGPTSHLIYGEAQAINSGTAAYFLGQRLLKTDKISDKDQLKLYDLYFEALCTGHAGQAIDLDGFDEMLPKVVETGEASELERSVLAVHRLKTAAPAACLARMGAIAGNGTEQQVEALGGFFEALGLAFQIIDDVLNLRGFKGDLKSRGEDIMQGKITLPVAKALSRLDASQRKWLHETLQSKPQDPSVVAAVTQVLEDCSAVQDCADEARRLVEEAWRRLNPLVEDSLAKMMLRAFGWFVLERHY